MLKVSYCITRPFFCEQNSEYLFKSGVQYEPHQMELVIVSSRLFLSAVEIMTRSADQTSIRGSEKETVWLRAQRNHDVAMYRRLLFPTPTILRRFDFCRYEPCFPTSRVTRLNERSLSRLRIIDFFYILLPAVLVLRC